MQYHLSTLTKKGFAYDLYEVYSGTTIFLAKFDIYNLHDLDVVWQMRNVNFYATQQVQVQVYSPEIK